MKLYARNDIFEHEEYGKCSKIKNDAKFEEELTRRFKMT